MIPRVNDSKEELIDGEEPSYDYESTKKVNWCDRILLNRPLKIIIAVILLGILLPILLYQFVYMPSGDWPPQDGYSAGTCVINRNDRLPCGNGPMNQRECHPQCCYDMNNKMCYHRFPSRFSYIFNQRWNENVVTVPRIPTVPYRFQSSTVSLRISVDEISTTHFSLTFYDSQKISLNGARIENKTYDYQILPQELNVVVNSAQGRIFETVSRLLIASDNIWEIAFRITNETMFGLGELPLIEGAVKILYNHDGGLSGIPLIFAKSNGSYHGLLIDTKGPTEVSIIGRNNIVVRSITKEGLKFHIFVGPKPADVMKDARKLVGSYKQLEYWMLGAHICNEFDGSYEEKFEHLTNFINSANQEQLPYESHCGTTPIVYENRCIAEDRFIDEGGQLVRNANKKFVSHLAPYIRFGKYNATHFEDPNRALDEENIDIALECVDMSKDFMEFIIRDPDAKYIYNAKVGNYSVIYPDYKNVTREFLENVWPLNVYLDGIYLENTWPIDESIKNHTYAYSAFPYFNSYFENAFNNTLLWNTTLPNGEAYFSKHNEYSNNFIKAVYFASDNMPTWTSSQRMNGDVMINRQNVKTSWTNLRRELIEAALGGISGHWQWSTPICGDTDSYNNETQIELCMKWYMAATYMPMIKIHSKSVARDPLSFQGHNKAVIIDTLKLRLSLLPYFYTVLQEGPLLRPMFYQFPSSDALVNLTTQYSVGDAMLIVPNLIPGQSHVHVQIPPGTWFELWSGLKLDAEEGDTVTMTTTTWEFLALLRGGAIIPMQKDTRETAEQTRLQSAFSLTIAIGCELQNLTNQFGDTIEENICEASGSLYMTDNMTLNFAADTNRLTITANGDDYDVFCSTNALWASSITELIIYGLDEDRNTHDHYKQRTVEIDLCHLETQPEVVQYF